MSEFYAAAIDSGLAAMLAWMDEHKHTAKDLPDDVWKSPKDCPLWKMGLSAAQAGGIYARARSMRP